jgi:hypothetical protein
VGHKTHAAGVVFVGGVVQALLLHVLDVAGVGHTKLLKMVRGGIAGNRKIQEDIAMQQLCQAL